MEKVIDNLECVLRKKYNFCGTLKDIRFESNSVEEAFQLLIDRLEASVVKTKDEDTTVQSLVTTPKPRDNVANVGDIALVYWLGTGWFTARIEDWDPSDLSFLVRWTDGNWIPEKAKFSNVCIDRVPNEECICVGTKVLFKQGLFYCGFNDDGTGRTLTQDQKNELKRKNQISDRWHVGVITDIKASAVTGEENKFYSGHHVEQGDPQCTRGNYVDYSPTFTGLMIEELRVFTDVSSIKNVSLESKQIDSKPINSDSSSKSLVTTPKPGDNVANVGDIALVYWLGTGWFTARIEDWDPSDLSFLVRWTDGNWIPEKAKFSNVCIDRVPNEECICVGTKVLFKQGLFYCGFNDDGTGRTLTQNQKNELKRKNQISDRWHVGVITDIKASAVTGEENKFYSGHHVEQGDPQCTRGNYVDYSTTFTGLMIEELRVFTDVSSIKNVSLESKQIDSKPFNSDSSSKYLATISKPGHNVANVGDIALVYWLGTGWFTARIEVWDPSDLSFLVRWTDGNWIPEKAKFSNVCIDRVPNEECICVGTKVLFKQGLFYCGFNDDGTGRTLTQDQKNELKRKNQISDRWHVGVITDIKASAVAGEERKFYSGHHVEQGDPQCTRGNYVDYSPTFEKLTVEMLRVFLDTSSAEKTNASAVYKKATENDDESP